MKDLIGAIAEEQAYVSDHMHGVESSLLKRLSSYGYESLVDYFNDKRNHYFNEWIPEVYPIDVRTITTELENAVRNAKYGVYISTTDGLYAFHGSDEIDYALCDELGIQVAELYHNGGTIIGSPADLGIEIVAPRYIGLESAFILNKFYEIISQYVENVSIDGNDILVDGKKVMGSMQRNVGNVYVWAAQVSFGDYSDIIAQVCNKQSVKKPSYIDSDLLTRDELEAEVLAWLCKS